MPEQMHNLDSHYRMSLYFEIYDIYLSSIYPYHLPIIAWPDKSLPILPDFSPNLLHRVTLLHRTLLHGIQESILQALRPRPLHLFTRRLPLRMRSRMREPDEVCCARGKLLGDAEGLKEGEMGDVGFETEGVEDEAGQGVL